MTRFGGRDEPSIERQVVTRIDHLEGVVTDHIKQDLVPRISEHHRISVKTDPVEFLYFNRLTYGRTCSCWSDVETEPDDGCGICFGTGYVTGFKKWGTVWECLDTTAQCTMVNIAPDYDRQARPVPLTLINGAVRGYIEWTVQLRANTGALDMLRLGASQPQGTRVTVQVRTTTEVSFTNVTGKSQVEDRLVDSDGRPNTLVFRVNIRRAPKAKSPAFSFLHLRYRTRDDLKVVVDIPRDNESITLSEMGVYDSWQVLQMVFGNKLRNLNTRDFFVRVRDGKRWKLTELTPFKPLGHLAGFDGTARLVQQFEPYARVP